MMDVRLCGFCRLAARFRITTATVIQYACVKHVGSSIVSRVTDRGQAAAVERLGES